MNESISVKDFGARGDGQADDADAIQKALEAGASEVRVPPGTYIIGRTLLIESDTTLRLDDGAVLRLADGTGPRLGVDGFLITNRSHDRGNQNIRLEGGVWDGNNPANPRGPDGPRDSYTGAAINFRNVNDLTISGLTVRDPEAFFIRICDIHRFLVEDIHLEAPNTRPNQDGVHLNGFCEDGVIRRITAKGAFCPNDDMIALNANDDVTRAINLGMREGPIRRLRIEDVSAEDAYTFVRLLSQDAPIEDVTISGISGGFRYHVLNATRWRFPSGKGRVGPVRVENLKVARRPSSFTGACVGVTLAVQDLEISGFRRLDEDHPEIATLEVDNGTVVEALLHGLDPEQCRALEKASSSIILEEEETADGERALRAKTTANDYLKLPFGGFDRFQLKIK